MDLYSIKVERTNHELTDLSAYQGKVLLIFNSATKCGYTNQYEGIEALYEKYKEKGFEVLDFPSNQFMNQAPGSSEEVSNFCKLKFNTKFETFAKVDVNGKNQSGQYTNLFENNGQIVTVSGILLGQMPNYEGDMPTIAFILFDQPIDTL